MSEKVIVELKKEDRDLLQSAIDALKKGPAAKVTESETERKTGPSHQSIEEMLNCPECGPKVRAKVLQERREKTKESELVCEECGLPVTEEEESCPACGGTSAKRK